MQFRFTNDATSRALGIPEIVQTIFATMEIETPHVSALSESASTLDVDSKIALGRAAQVCRNFSSAALDVLWKNMRTIVPLLLMLGLVKRADGRYSLQQEFPSYQWARLEAYARRIRRLADDTPPDIDELVVIRIVQHMRGKCLLPMLQSLSYTFSPHIHLLISARLRNIAIHGDRILEVERWRVADFFHALTIDVPLLERVKFTGTWIQNVPSIVAELQHLHTITLRGAILNQQSLAAVLSLPQLSLLVLQFYSPQPRLPPPSELKTSSLRHIVLIGDPLIVSDILSHLTMSPLTQIEIGLHLLRRSSLEESFRGCTRDILSWSESLILFDLTCLSYPSLIVATDDLIPLNNVLKPLQKLQKLRSLRVQYPHGLQGPSDKDYLELALACPRIRWLSLVFIPETSTPLATFLTLHHFATQCPYLDHLAVHVDLSTLPASPLITSHPLRELHIHAPLPVTCDPGVLARYLDALFPDLDPLFDNVKAPEWHTNGSQDRLEWAKVEKYRDLFQTARMDDIERHRHVKIDGPNQITALGCGYPLSSPCFG